MPGPRPTTSTAADLAAIIAQLDQARADPRRRRPGRTRPAGNRRSRTSGATAAPGPRPAAASRRPGAAATAAPGAAGRGAGPGPAGTPVQISVLGPLQITAGGREIGTGLRKARELLAFLAVHPDGATGEAISEALWPGAPPGHGTRQRNLALRKARDLLRAATGLTTPMWITLTAGRYRLDPTLIDTDLRSSRPPWTPPGPPATTRPAWPRCARPSPATGARSPTAPATTGPSPTPRPPAAAPWTPGHASPRSSSPPTPTRRWPRWRPRLTHDPYNEYLYQQIMRLQAAAGRPDAVRRTLPCWKPGSASSASRPAPRPARPPPPSWAPGTTHQRQQPPAQPRSTSPGPGDDGAAGRHP